MVWPCLSVGKSVLTFGGTCSGSRWETAEEGTGRDWEERQSQWAGDTWFVIRHKPLQKGEIGFCLESVAEPWSKGLACVLGAGNLMHSAVPGEEARDYATEQVCFCQQRRALWSPGPKSRHFLPFP